MFPTLFTYQGIGFHTWGMMVMLAFLAAFMLVSARARRVGIDSDNLVPLYLLVSIFGLMGSRLLHFVFAETDAFMANPLVFFDMGQGGFAFLGGVIGGVASGALYAWWSNIPVWKLADIAAAAIMLALAVGRMGCFFAGCCHGRAWHAGHGEGGDPVAVLSTVMNFKGGSIVSVGDFPWVALTFKQGVGVGAVFDTPLYPTQLLEITAGLTIFAILSVMWKRFRFFDGQIIAAMLVLYAFARFNIENLRGDAVRGVDHFGLFSTSQLVAIGMVGTAAVIVVGHLVRIKIFKHDAIPPEIPIVEDEDSDEDDTDEDGAEE
jgi:phosphatidylglycerol:prolipoprotein diacylglycerol transferase